MSDKISNVDIAGRLAVDRKAAMIRAFASSEVPYLSLRWLAGVEALGLEVLHDSGRDFCVVHPCELEDPRRFVGRDAVILLTGIAFESRPQALGPYVERMAAAGLTGIGFGVGLAFPEVPAELVAAARKHDVSLFAIPLQVPFISVLAAVHEEVARLREQEMAGFIKAQGALNDAASAGLSALVTRTAQVLDAHVCLVDLDGRAAAQHMRAGLPHLDLEPVIDELRAHSFAAARRVGQWSIIAHKLAEHGEHSFGLVVAGTRIFTANERALLRQAAGLAELIVKRPQELRRTQGELNSMAMAIQLGIGQAENPMTRILATAADSQGRVRPILVKADSARAHKRFVDALDARLADNGRLLFALGLEEGSSLLLFRGSRTMKNIADLLHGIRGNQRIVVGIPMPWGELSLGVVHELEAIAFGLQPGAMAGPESRTLGWLKDAQVQDLLRHRARETWGKIRRRDAEEGTQLAETLEAYLRCGGHVSRTAENLSTHRHTVRKRIALLEGLLELDLKDPLVAAELLILGVNDRA
ncbi:PucR family transcriptional regulator [Corynebacterium lizhenjunii]|uniref:PucR family transcriptional regulator n=1 Tax=Corynebacterium lizhenjunii TaxID=2709394 RepID=UPI001FD022E2|nr:PucR family transcriptional regulator [Corynebacterium lizhenjunii]